MAWVTVPEPSCPTSLGSDDCTVSPVTVRTAVVPIPLGSPVPTLSMTVPPKVANRLRCLLLSVRLVSSMRAESPFVFVFVRMITSLLDPNVLRIVSRRLAGGNPLPPVGVFLVIVLGLGRGLGVGGTGVLRLALTVALTLALIVPLTPALIGLGTLTLMGLEDLLMVLVTVRSWIRLVTISLVGICPPLVLIMILLGWTCYIWLL